MSEIVYLPCKKRETETEKAVLFSYNMHTPFYVAKMMQTRKERHKREAEEMIEQREQAWIPKSVILKEDGEFLLLKFKKKEWGHSVKIICEGRIDDLIRTGREAEIKYELALEHALDIIQTKNLEIKISEEEWREYLTKKRGDAKHES